MHHCTTASDLHGSFAGDKLFGMTTDHREGARARIADLVTLLQSSGGAGVEPIVAECDALSRAIAAFHMEGIRFRIYNVDRLLHARPASSPEQTVLLEQIRAHLEAAGFHTRSHQSPIQSKAEEA